MVMMMVMLIMMLTILLMGNFNGGPDDHVDVDTGGLYDDGVTLMRILLMMMLTNVIWC